MAFALEYAPRARIMSIEIGLYTAPLTAPPMDQWTSISFLCAEDDSDEVSYSHDRLQQFTVQLLDYQCSWVVYQWVEWLILGWLRSHFIRYTDGIQESSEEISM